MSEDSHEHDWQLLEIKVTNTANATKMSSAPNKARFLCHCGKYKTVEPEEIQTEKENWSNTGKML